MGGLHKSPKLNCRRWGSPLWRLMSCHVTTRLFTFTGAVWKLLQLREPGWDIKDFCQVKSSLSPDADIKHEQSKFFFHLQLVFLSLGVGGSGKGDKGLFSVNVAVADLKARTLKTVLNGLDFLQMLINTDKIYLLCKLQRLQHNRVWSLRLWRRLLVWHSTQDKNFLFH